MKLERAHVELLESWTETNFADWLQSGYFRWYAENYTRRSFEPMHMFISVEDTLAADLAAIHNALPPKTALSMRKGMSIAIACEEESRLIVSELLDLATLTMARGILSVLPDKIALFVTDDGDDSQKFLLKALFTVGELAINTGDSVLYIDTQRCLKYIVKSPAFSPELSGAIFTTLCRLKPNDLEAHLLYLRRHLNKVYGNISDEEASERHLLQHSLIEEICDLVGIEVLYSSLNLDTRWYKNGIDWWDMAVRRYFNWYVGSSYIHISVPSGESLYIKRPSWYKNKYAVSMDEKTIARYVEKYPNINDSEEDHEKDIYNTAEEQQKTSLVMDDDCKDIMDRINEQFSMTNSSMGQEKSYAIQ